MRRRYPNDVILGALIALVLALLLIRLLWR